MALSGKKRSVICLLDSSAATFRAGLVNFRSYAERSPGTFAVLLQIQLAQEMGLDHVYLGYWIADCQKMSYKTNYQPLEVLEQNTWRVLG